MKLIKLPKKLKAEIIENSLKYVSARKIIKKIEKYYGKKIGKLVREFIEIKNEAVKK